MILNIQSEFNARLFDELEPAYPDMNVNDGVTSYSVAGANGTYAGVNIVMSGITPGIPVTFDVKGEHTGFKLFNMIAVPVEVNTGAKQRSEYLKNDHNDNVIRRAPFMVYDALEPIYNIVMPTMTTMAVSFKSIIEYIRENRTQAWEITVTHGQTSITLKLEVELFSNVVPKAGLDTHKFVNWFSFNAIAKLHNLVKWSAEYENMMEKYFRVAVFSRQNMLAIPLDEVFEIKDGKPILNICRLETIIRIAKKTGMAWFQGGAVAERAVGQSDDDEFYNSLDHENFTSTDDVAARFRFLAFDYFDNGDKAQVSLTHELLPGKAGEDTIRSIAKQLNTFIVEHDLVDVWVQCGLDEPNDAMCAVYRVITGIIKEEMPKTPILEPVLPTQAVVGALDIWCPSLDIYEQNQEFFDNRVKEGDRLFVYSCLTPGGNYCNRLLDLERLRIVWLSWAPIKYSNIEGFLHWGANQYTQTNPFTRQAQMFSEQVLEFHPKRANFLPAGDFCIFYPGYNEPMISVRSESHRIGYEDLCMLEELKKKNPKKAQELVAMVFRGYMDFEKSVSKYREVKRMIMIELAK